MLVKLQRPPPEMRIFSPSSSAWSSNNTRRPRLPASMAHIIPAAPAPMMTTSALTAPAPRSPDQVKQYQQDEDAAADPGPDRHGEFCTPVGGRLNAVRLNYWVRRWRDGLVEAGEEVVRHFLGHAFDQPRTDLREFAADAGRRLVR